MNFETEYKNIHFHISLEKGTASSLKLSNYNLIIKSKKGNEERTHYWSNVLLPNDSDLLQEELGHYLEDEEILDLIVLNWKVSEKDIGPAWKLADPKIKK